MVLVAFDTRSSIAGRENVQHFTRFVFVENFGRPAL